MKVLLLAGNTLRSRAYAQQLSHCDGVVVFGMFLGFNQKKCDPVFLNDETKFFLIKSKLFIPDLSEDLHFTFEKNGWTFISTDTTDVNSDEIISTIKDLNIDLIIFSGYGGQILCKNHFLKNTPYLHMHPGFLPEERGSTTIYYSILNNRKCSVTAFFMTAQIDNGDILVRKLYPIPIKGVDIDYWYDNVIRADCLFETINLLKEPTVKVVLPFDQNKSEEYYIIHPVLKHLSILKTNSD